jgi:hypothetical protein
LEKPVEKELSRLTVEEVEKLAAAYAKIPSLAS